MDHSKQKHYRAPALVIHGDVEDITREADQENLDTPTGPDDTDDAYPVS